MDFIIGAGIFFAGLIVGGGLLIFGYSLRDNDSSGRIETLEAEMDQMQDEFVPAVVQSVEAIAADIKRLSDNDGCLADAYQSVSVRLSNWVTESQTEE